MRESLEEKLLTVLSAIGSYNDKGWYWMRHDDSKIAAQRDIYARTLTELLDSFGVGSLSTEALTLFEVDSVVSDGSGNQLELAKNLLASGNFYAERSA